jgi:hypothetical protein
MKKISILITICIILFTIVSIGMFPNSVAAVKYIYMTADIWTNKGGQGRGTTGGTYKVGDQITLYAKFTYCSCGATLTVSGPGGTSSTQLSLTKDITQSIPLGTADQSDVGVWQAQLVPRSDCTCGGPDRTDVVAFSVTGTVTPTPPPTITIPYTPPPVTQPSVPPQVTPAPSSPPVTTPPASASTTNPVKSGSVPITIDASTASELKALLALKIADGKLATDSKLDADNNGKVDMADARRFLKLAVKKQ